MSELGERGAAETQLIGAQLSDAPPRTSPAAVGELRSRLHARRVVVDPWSSDDRRGVDEARLRALLQQWESDHDWLANESTIRALPWAVAANLRVIHRPAAAAAPVVVLLHGWPDSVLRFQRVLPLLTDTTIVVPALPGFPFAVPQRTPASVGSIAAEVAAALTALGYDRWVVSGADIGGDVAEVLAERHPDRVAALHLCGVSARHVFGVDPAELPPKAREYIGTAMGWNRDNGGYVAVQSTRPSTLMVGLADSPAGMAAWLLEKLLSWSDRADASFSDDELLTWISAYWFDGCIGTSFSTYAESAAIPRRTSVPTVVSAFGRDIKPAPREWAEQFVDLREHLEHDAGGHFAAWEQPELFVADLRRAIALAEQGEQRD